MGGFVVGFVLPMLLLSSALLNWSLISVVDLVAFLLVLFNGPYTGFRFRRKFPLLWFVIVFSLFVTFLQATYFITCAIEGHTSVIEETWWIELIGIMRVQSWRTPVAVYFLVLQILVALVALFGLYGSRVDMDHSMDSCLGQFSGAIEYLGTHLRVISCLVLPLVQLVVGISRPSWVSLPFFLCSCIGLVEWSLTSNFLGFFRWWRLIRLYAGANIVLLYIYQLPLPFFETGLKIADFIGLYKISSQCKGQEICSGFSLLIFYTMLSYIRNVLEDMNHIMSNRGSDLTAQLLPSSHSFFVHESRSGVRRTNSLLRGAAFQIFSINFFTYGFPISLLALSFWSFHFASICAFGLLAYVGYTIYAFPSLFRLHRLNGLLLVFILIWAVSTYIFNVALVFLNWKLGKNMEIWEMIGLWHYPIPGFFLLAQFCLGILVAVGNLVNNSVFQCLSDDDGQSSRENSIEEESETRVLIVATIAWGLRKSSRAIMLVLIFVIAMKPGFIHAVYIIFFLIYLLSHTISRKIQQSLILLCEVHFAVLYILQLNLIYQSFEEEGSLSMTILSQLGLVDCEESWELIEIALLACFCAVHNHGFDTLFSFSAIVQHSPRPPIGFSILKAGLNKSVLLSVYSSRTARSNNFPSRERRIASFLSAISQKFLSVYRSCGTYIAFLTILFTVYLVQPNYISFGYMCLLLFWLIGRQLVEKTKRPLWFPLKAYAIVIFISVYILSIFPSFQMLLSRMIDLYPDLGYDPGASLLQNIWESLAVVIVMQLYSYERRQSEHSRTNYSSQTESGFPGFLKRVLIWHGQKILFITLFYASLSPLSIFGFVYLVGLVIFSMLPKTSRIPSKTCLVYTGLLMSSEYLFQMWGRQAEMLPGQKYYDLSLLLGFRVFGAGFWGFESGFRGKALVISACTLQYNLFCWLAGMPSELLHAAKCGESCPLFVRVDNASSNVFISGQEDVVSLNTEAAGILRRSATSNSWPSFNFYDTQNSHSVPSKSKGSESSGTRKYSFGFMWESTKETNKWNKKLILAMRKERFEMQKTSLIIYLKFWLENMFNLFGLEINMIALLLASFALLNAVSMLYIASLAACVLLDRRVMRKLWLVFVILFASILILEYVAIWRDSLLKSKGTESVTNMNCHDCWSTSSLYFHFCRNCWLGYIVDDPRMIISYYVVFMFSCFKLHADHFPSSAMSIKEYQIVPELQNVSVWQDLSFETKSVWTLLDHLRVYIYCHLLDLVLSLILITGTLEYDILHLGYLGFALVFLRMRPEILKKRNRIFNILRIYNFAVIVLSLIYQSPFIGKSSGGKCSLDYIYEMIGFHKYDYGFRIASTSALVEIIIFILVSLQSSMFSSQEFDYVSRYLEAEQIDAIVREQEKKASMKTSQLKRMRESEEKKHQRNMQVEKMKSEMLNLKVQLQMMSSVENGGTISHSGEGLRKRNPSVVTYGELPPSPDQEEVILKKEQNISVTSITPMELHESVASTAAISSTVDSGKHTLENSYSLDEITEMNDDAVDYGSEKTEKARSQTKENPLISAVQLIGDGVSQVQSIGNQAVNDLANFFNIQPEDGSSNEHSSAEDGVYDEIESQRMAHLPLERYPSLQSDKSRPISESVAPKIRRIVSYIWSQIQSHNDAMCYFCFLLVFLWNFSLLSMVYLGALFLYALCVNTGPGYIFWISALIYTEMNILLQYLYQIFLQHCGLNLPSSILQEFGFPTHKIVSSFVISSFPLFLVYLFTLIQSSIIVRDGEWISSTGFNLNVKKNQFRQEFHVSSSWGDRARKFLESLLNFIKVMLRRFSCYWKSLIQGAESPPYFVQLSMDVPSWPADGIQPERIESGINQLLHLVHDERFKKIIHCPCSPSKVHVQSIERSQENPCVALAVLEVVHAAPLSESMSGGWYASLTPAGDVAKEIIEARKLGYVEEIAFPYPLLSVIGEGKREVDLYAYIFGADLSVFFLVAIFYQSVIKNNTEFLEVYQLEDQFPKEFVFILMVIFFLIVLDRVIYLCSFALGKVVYYIFNLILFTYSVTVYAWHMNTLQHHTVGFVLRGIYLMKAVSLALQAIQIRYGLPHQSTLYRQFLTSKTSRINYIGYRIYRTLPFLYELRCVLDWSCTTTSLTMYDWLKLEDIHSSLYLVKCDAVLNRATHKIGEKQKNMTKLCSGVCLFFVLLCVIWAPMLMYSSGNPTNIANPIKEASAKLDLKSVGGRLNLFHTTLCERLPWVKIKGGMDLDPQGLLDTYAGDDIQLICCQADATTLWIVPGVVQKRFIQSLDEYMNITFSWELNRDRPKGKETVRYERSVDPLDLPQQSSVQEVLNGTTNSFQIYNIYPRFFRVTGSGDVRPLDLQESMVTATLLLNHGSLEWWSFHDNNSSYASACGGLTGPMAIVVSEEIPPQGILGDTLNKFSIWGLYITFVLAVGRFIRLNCSDLRMRIPYENLPSCDRLIAICEDIYAARAEGELGVEEVLYWTLIKIYRSPHMLLEYTKSE